jgi:hypothetical protein
MNVKCKFCQQEPEYKPLKEMSNLGVKVYFCFKCNAEYLYWQNDQLGSISLYLTLNNNMYRWTDSLNGFMILYHVYIPGIPGEKVNALKSIFCLTPEQAKPEITPDNIANKIRNYLLLL